MNSELPIGTVLHYLGTEAQLDRHDWLFMDGRAVAKHRYPELYRVLVESGVVVEATGPTFTLPDAKDRFLMMRAASGTGSTLGGTGGSVTHDHGGAHATHASQGAHTHDSHSGSSSTTSTALAGPTTHASQGGHTHDAHTSHTTAQPSYVAMNAIIKAQ